MRCVVSIKEHGESDDRYIVNLDNGDWYIVLKTEMLSTADAVKEYLEKQIRQRGWFS